jgi:hypothetical protein
LTPAELRFLDRSQLRTLLADATRKLRMSKETVGNTPVIHIPFPKLSEMEFLEQRIKEYRRELRRRFPRARLFFVYSHEDEAVRDELDRRLEALKKGGMLETFHDRRIGPGRDWDGEIEQELRDADVVVLLVSPGFFSSDYCRRVEIPAALEQQASGVARVIPIVIKACNFEKTEIATLQALPKGGKPLSAWDNPEQAWADIEAGILRAIQDEGLGPGS